MFSQDDFEVKLIYLMMQWVKIFQAPDVRLRLRLKL